eukprot:s826_g8.t1
MQNLRIPRDGKSLHTKGGAVLPVFGMPIEPLLGDGSGPNTGRSGRSGRSVRSSVSGPAVAEAQPTSPSFGAKDEATSRSGEALTYAQQAKTAALGLQGGTGPSVMAAMATAETATSEVIDDGKARLIERMLLRGMAPEDVAEIVEVPSSQVLGFLGEDLQDVDPAADADATPSGGQLSPASGAMPSPKEGEAAEDRATWKRRAAGFSHGVELGKSSN